MSTFAEYKERKLERLRLGQAACEIVHLISDDDTRLALVPLTEGEYSSSLGEADKVLAGDNPAGAAVRDETQRQMVIFYAAREVGDLTVKFFKSIAEVLELDAHDVNHIYDVYLEMVALNSPMLMGMSEEDFLALKLVLPRIPWSELSGTQWYAAQRFLNSIQPLLLMVNNSGSLPTMKSTDQNENEPSAKNAE